MNEMNINDERNGPREDKKLPSLGRAEPPRGVTKCHSVRKRGERSALLDGGPGRGMGLQLLLATLLVAFGVALITVAFFVPPMGVIDPTVLTAFGEILTFAGSLIGIDYHYRYKPPNED